MVEHMMPAVGLLIFGTILMFVLTEWFLVLLGFIMFTYSVYYIAHHSLLRQHHR